MKSIAAVIAILISAAMLSNALAQEQTCRIIRADRADFLEQCGEQLRSFTMTLWDIRRQVGRDLHGRFSFYCPVEPLCVDEPTIGGFFIPPANWQNGPKDERAVYAMLRSGPLMAISWSHRAGELPPPMPPPVCPLFDVSIGGIAGRAVCFDQAETKGTTVVVVAADDRVGFVLTFYQKDKAPAALRDKVLGLIPKFKIERATGDAALLRWFR